MTATPTTVSGPTSGPLTPRQHEILVLVAAGLDNRTIGRRLSLAEDTVKTHLRHAYDRLGATGRAHAVALCYDRGLFPGGAERLRKVAAARRRYADELGPRSALAIGLNSEAAALEAAARILTGGRVRA